MFLLKVTFYLTKTENRTKISLTQLSHYCFEKGTILAKDTVFLENADISKIKRTLALKSVFSKTTDVCVCVFRAKFEVSSIILTSFRQGW